MSTEKNWDNSDVEFKEGDLVCPLGHAKNRIFGLGRIIKVYKTRPYKHESCAKVVYEVRWKWHQDNDPLKSIGGIYSSDQLLNQTETVVYMCNHFNFSIVFQPPKTQEKNKIPIAA